MYALPPACVFLWNFSAAFGRTVAVSIDNAYREKTNADLKKKVGGAVASWLERSTPGSSPGRGHCVVFLGKTLNSQGASLHPGV